MDMLATQQMHHVVTHMVFTASFIRLLRVNPVYTPYRKQLKKCLVKG